MEMKVLFIPNSFFFEIMTVVKFKIAFITIQVFFHLAFVELLALDTILFE